MTLPKCATTSTLPPIQNEIFEPMHLNEASSKTSSRGASQEGRNTWIYGLVHAIPSHEFECPGGHHHQEVQPIVVVPQVGCGTPPKSQGKDPSKHLQPGIATLKLKKSFMINCAIRGQVGCTRSPSTHRPTSNRSNCSSHLHRSMITMRRMTERGRQRTGRSTG
jgi:hypothetical protein